MLKHIRSSSEFRSPRQINESLTGMFAGPFCGTRFGRRQSDSVIRRYMPSRVLNCVFMSSRLPVASLHEALAIASYRLHRMSVTQKSDMISQKFSVACKKAQQRRPTKQPTTSNDTTGQRKTQLRGVSVLKRLITT